MIKAYLLTALMHPLNKRSLGICHHVERSLRNTLSKKDIERVKHLLERTAFKIMGYPESHFGMSYWMFPLDGEGNYQVPELKTNSQNTLQALHINGVYAVDLYDEAAENAWDCPLGSARYKLMVDMIRELEK